MLKKTIALASLARAIAVFISEATEKVSVGWDNEAGGTELGRLHLVNNRMLIPLESFCHWQKIPQ